MSDVRVAFDHQIFDFQSYGGVSRYICELASKLADRPDCLAAVVAPLHINQYLRQVGAPVEVSACYVGGVPKVRRLARAINSTLGPAMIRRFRPDIVHRTYYQSGLPALESARTVITVHDMIHERLSDRIEPDSTVRSKRAAVFGADHAICISEYTRRDLIEIFDIDPRKTSVIHHGFDLMNGEAAQLSDLPEREFILFVGQRGGYKNFSGLLAAYAASARLRDNFDVVCFGGGAITAAEIAEITHAGFRQDSIRHFHGSDSVLIALYQRAAVFVYPSLYEGFGIPPLEAMSFRCPVVCAPVTSVPEVVGDAAAFFDPNETDSLVHAIERVTDDTAFRALLVQRGTERLAHFSWQRCAQETLQVYRELLA